jgi:hypothetical protein
VRPLADNPKLETDLIAEQMRRAAQAEAHM